MKPRWIRNTLPVLLPLALALVAVSGARAVEVRVVDSANRRPIAGARVAWRVGDTNTSSCLAGVAGTVEVVVPAQATGTVRVTASKEGFTPMTMEWNTGNVPATFVLVLPETQRLGGRFLDEEGKPVEGARVLLNLPERLAGPRVAIEELVLKSDPEGRWRCESVPKDAAYVFVEVSHPGFDSLESEVALEALRAETAVFKLSPVSTVRGRVFDDAGRAIPDADLALGNEGDIWPGNATLETRTDAGGAFKFPRVRLAKRLLGVRAPAFAPALRSIEIKRNAAPVDIQLKPGTPLRVRVLDAAGRPIAGVAAEVNEWPSGSHRGADRVPGRWAYPGWEWETDAEGRLTWSNAPPDMMLWTFKKGGYMSRGHHGLQASTEEQLVTLGPPFHVNGRVTDATNGQPVTEFVLTPRYAHVDSLRNGTRTNFGGWNEYQRKTFSDGTFRLHYDYPLYSGGQRMHDWQFRIEADGYEPAVSRLVRDEERGLQLDFRLAPRPLPDIDVPAPTNAKRVTAGVAIQPRTVRLGDTLTLFLKARVAAGHHVYALQDSGCRNPPSSLDAALRNVLAPDGPWRGPEPKIRDDGSRTFAGEVLFKRRYLVERNAGRQTHKVPVTFRFQVCNEAFCWPPETIALETEFEVVASPE